MVGLAACVRGGAARGRPLPRCFARILAFALLPSRMLGLHAPAPPTLRDRVVDALEGEEGRGGEGGALASEGADRLAQPHRGEDVAGEAGDPATVGYRLLKTLQPKMYHLHVPVTAGESLNGDAEFFGVPSMQFKQGSREGCYSWRKYFPAGHRAITMLRNPREHVLGQYMHCRYSTSSLYRMMHHEDVPASFEAWVHDWAAWRRIRFKSGSANAVWEEKDQPHPCYAPIEMQTHRLTCDKPSRMHLNLNATAAVENLRKMEFVGIMEAYHESLCTFRAKLGMGLPAGCNCSDPAAWSRLRFRHLRHGVPPHGFKGYNASTLAAVDSLTSADRVLYRAAVERFLEDVAAVEASHGMKVLCKDLVGAVP